MNKIIFTAQVKQFNRKALASGDTQIRLIIDCVDTPEKQSEIMREFSDLQLGEKLVKVEIGESDES